MKDVRKLEAGDSMNGAGTHVSGTMEGDFAIPDFTCNACWNGVFGEREPVRCVRCGGLHFSPRPTLAEGPLAFANAIGRLSQETKRLLAVSHRGGVSVKCRLMLGGVERKLRLALVEFYAAGHATAKEWKEDTQ
jgi:hypothetical protein